MSQRTYVAENVDSEVKEADSGASLPKRTETRWLKDTFIFKPGWRVKCELAVVIVLIFIVWGLLSLPIVFYYTTENQVQNGVISQTPLNTMNNDSYISVNDTDISVTDTHVVRNGTHACLNKYTGSRCVGVLQELTTCESADSGRTDVYISNLIEDQNAIEEEIRTLILAVSDECRNKLIPFFCLYKFGLCCENVTDYRPTAAECSNIRDSVCVSGWKKAADLLKLRGFPALPNCSSLRLKFKTWNATPCNIDCHDHFYCENNSCKPRCDRFMEYSDEYIILSDVLMILSGSIGLLCGIVVVVIFVIRYKAMMVFPVILVFYMTISILGIDIVFLIAFMDRSELFCNSIDFVDSFEHPTPFCKLSGVVKSYFIIQATLLWLFHIFAIFWKIQFPFHSCYFNNTNRTKYIHGTCVVLALIFPIIPAVIISVEGGFIMTIIPPIGCVGREPKANFYGFAFPATLMYAVGTTVLLAILWIIRRHMINPQGKSGSSFQFSVAECKLFLVFICYLVCGALELTIYSIENKHYGHDVNAMISYFKCQQLGNDSKCSLDTHRNHVWVLIGTISLLLFPAINLVYAIKGSDVKMLLKLCSGVKRIGIQAESKMEKLFLQSSQQVPETETH